jgi:hypothetical protein
MKTENHHGKLLRSAIGQVKVVAEKKRLQSQSAGPEKSLLLQEARQLDEAVRLLRWVTK